MMGRRVVEMARMLPVTVAWPGRGLSRSRR